MMPVDSQQLLFADDRVISGTEITLGPTPFGARFSECGKYRYSLWRRWGDGNLVSFLALNPSTADQENDDPTIRREIAFAKAWGYAGMVKLNIFAFRATDPKVMKSAADPIGPLNDEVIVEVIERSDVRQVVCCWGTHGGFMDRGSDVRELLRLHCSFKPYHLGLTKDGFPKHPLYLPANTERISW